MTRNAKALQGKSRTHTVTATADGFEVRSGASGNVYRVVPVLDGARCSCRWATRRPTAVQVVCSHVLAVYEWAARQAGHATSAWSSPVETARQHRSTQDVHDGVLLTVRRRA